MIAQRKLDYAATVEGWKLNDIRLSHDVLGIVGLQLQFRHNDGREVGYQLPIKLGENMAQTISAFSNLTTGIADMAFRYYIPPSQQ